jgi:hypothetical protein
MSLARMVVIHIEERLVRIDVGVGQCRQPDLVDLGRKLTLARVRAITLRAR